MHKYIKTYDYLYKNIENSHALTQFVAVRTVTIKKKKNRTYKQRVRLFHLLVRGEVSTYLTRKMEYQGGCIYRISL